jgi:predicted nucleotidyltransferase
MYLERILGTSTKVGVLNVLVNNPEKSYVEKDLAREAGAAVSEINRQMPELVASGLVRLERVGRTKVYAFNKKHFLAASLGRLFKDLNDVYGEAAGKISKFAASHSRKLKAVILIGSVAKRRVRSDFVRAPSDLDLVFVVATEAEKEGLFTALVSYINREIGDAYGIVCYPVVLAEAEYVEALRRKDSFILAVQTEGVELHGRKPRRFG